MTAGSVTVFFALAMLPAFALFLCLLYAGRFYVGQNDAARILSTSGNAVLTYYPEELAKRYGLFGTNRHRIETRMLDFMQRNENTQGLWPTGLFSYTTEGVLVSDCITLENADAFTEQIERYMKYRWTAEAFALFEDRLGMLRSFMQGQGVNAKFAMVMESVTQYNEVYDRLMRSLYGIDASVYVTMTREERYNIESFIAATRSDPMQKNIVNRWERILKDLIAKNESAAATMEELQMAYDRVFENKQTFMNCVASLSAQERSQTSVQEMVQDVDHTCEKLWGGGGSIKTAHHSLSKNVRLLRNLETALREDAEIGSAAEAMRDYDDTFSLSYAGVKAGKALNLFAIWEWLDDCNIDLTQYGSTENRLLENPESASLLERYGASQLQDSLSDRMLVLEHAGHSLGDDLRRHFSYMTYAEECFGNMLEPAGDNTFFRNEMEFLLVGTGNEFSNLNDVREDITALRTMLNMYHIISTPDKRQLLQGIAQSVGGVVLQGMGTAVIYTALLFLWSAAESHVDYATLVNGGKVPFLKNEETWKTDLQGILKQSREELDPPRGDEEGLSYKDYLMLLMAFEDEGQLIERLQTLINLNLQLEEPRFSLGDTVTAFTAIAFLKGQNQFSAIGTFAYD